MVDRLRAHLMRRWAVRLVSCVAAEERSRILRSFGGATVGFDTTVSSSAVLFSEQREKGRLPWRPFFGRSDVREARGLEFVDHDARRTPCPPRLAGTPLGI